MRINLFRAVFLALATGAVCSAHAAERVPAFPGAEGYGAWATGGRGGRIIAVTNLDDSGPGSLREALEETKEPRIVVFRVAGNIVLSKRIRISDGNVTLAGQTAPGGGICLQQHGLVIGAARNVIVRYLRVRPGDAAHEEMDALGGEDCENVIIDHCSVSWATDETLTLYRAKDVTIQWCIVSESLFLSAHHKGAHGYGGIWGGTRASWHHNLLAHHTSRNPRFAQNEQPIDYRNNVIYNWGFNSAYGGEGSTVNMVANCYVPGPATEKLDRILDAAGERSRWFVEDNRIVGLPELDADNWQGGVQSPWTAEKGLRLTKAVPAAYLTTETADQAHDSVLAGAGATLPARDPLDTRVIQEVRSRTAAFGKSFRLGGNGIVDTPADAGGWPVLAAGKPAPDKDGDGMPDNWELSHGLHPNDPSDGSGDEDEDGYTNVEEYLNGTLPKQFVDYSIPKALPVQTVKPAQPAKFWRTEIVVSADGKGHFKDLREAIAAAPALADEVFPITIQAGTYPGPVIVPEDKPLLRLEGKGKVIVEAGASGPALQILSGGCSVVGITFQGGRKTPAVQMDGDRTIVRDCVISGEEHALSVSAGRVFVRESRLVAQESLISGGGLTFLDRCELHASGAARLASITRPRGKGPGAVFSRCTITAEPGVTGIALGDDPAAEPEALYADMEMPEFVDGLWRTKWSQRPAKEFGKLVAPTVFLAGTDGWDPAGIPVPLAMLALATPKPPQRIDALGGNGHVSLSWDPVEGAQSYAVKRQKPGEDGFIKVVSNLHLPEWVDRDAAAGPARTYIINCTGRNGKNVDSAPVTAKISGDGLPAPWALRTWGKAGPGKAGFGNGTLTIEAPDDSTSWAWETLTRDAVMLIHLKKGGGHTGIRVQRTLDSDSPSLFLGIGAKGRSIMSWVASGDQADAREEGEIAAPCWFKLTRSRERYSGAVSTDGVSWSLVGETSVVPLGGPVYVGLVTSSGEAEFDGISFPLPPPPVSAAGSKVD